jgi:preprotein translocase subunit SecG
MNNDYIFWTFSAAAQSVSAFVALLLTGYALVLSLMDAVREKDDSLEDIHASLRSHYHRRLTWLAWLTGVAIVLSLVIVYLNRSEHAVSGWLQSVGAGWTWPPSAPGWPSWSPSSTPRSTRRRRPRCWTRRMPGARAGPTSPGRPGSSWMPSCTWSA